MGTKLLEFPPVIQPGFRPRPKTSEEIIAELAPTIQTEAELATMLEQVEPDKRSAIEKCLRANGACKAATQDES